MADETLPVEVQALSEEAQTLHTQFKAIDPQQKGVGLDRIALFHPKIGWSVILSWVAELEQRNMLTSKAVMNAKGRVGYRLYAWKEA